MDDLNTIYADLKNTAREIAARYGPPDFNFDFATSVAYSRQRLTEDRFLKSLAEFVQEQVGENFGHGVGHARKVARDAGVLTVSGAKRADYVEEEQEHLLLLAHCAGLLHDVRRRSHNHAARGAATARRHLAENQDRLDLGDIEIIALAISNHEAFKEKKVNLSPRARLVSDSLYDADKFRWGPDNFTHTVWDMIAPAPPPLAKFVRFYPRAMAHIASIKTTFRSSLGQAYGPQFIDLGLAIGKELLAVVKRRYAHRL